MNNRWTRSLANESEHQFNQIKHLPLHCTAHAPARTAHPHLHCTALLITTPAYRYHSACTSFPSIPPLLFLLLSSSHSCLLCHNNHTMLCRYFIFLDNDLLIYFFFCMPFIQQQSACICSCFLTPCIAYMSYRRYNNRHFIVFNNVYVTMHGALL